MANDLIAESAKTRADFSNFALQAFGSSVTHNEIGLKDELRLRISGFTGDLVFDAEETGMTMYPNSYMASGPETNYFVNAIFDGDYQTPSVRVKGKMDDPLTDFFKLAIGSAAGLVGSFVLFLVLVFLAMIVSPMLLFVVFPIAGLILVVFLPGAIILALIYFLFIREDKKPDRQFPELKKYDEYEIYKEDDRVGVGITFLKQPTENDLSQLVDDLKKFQAKLQPTK